MVFRMLMKATMVVRQPIRMVMALLIILIRIPITTAFPISLKAQVIPMVMAFLIAKILIRTTMVFLIH